MASKTAGDGPSGLMLAEKSATSRQSQPRSRADLENVAAVCDAHRITPASSATISRDEPYSSGERRRRRRNPGAARRRRDTASAGDALVVIEAAQPNAQRAGDRGLRIARVRTRLRARVAQRHRRPSGADRSAGSAAHIHTSTAVRRAGTKLARSSSARRRPTEFAVPLVAVTDHAVQRVDRLVGRHRRPARRAPGRTAAP